LVLLAMAFTLLIPAAAGAQTAAGRKRPPKKGGAGAGGVVPGGRKRPPKKPGPGPEAPVPGGEGEEGAEEEKPPVRTVKPAESARKGCLSHWFLVSPCSILCYGGRLRKGCLSHWFLVSPCSILCYGGRLHFGL